MLKLRYADNDGIYHGFKLKAGKGVWYGIDTETGRHIVTTSIEMSNDVAVYFLEESGWNMKWIDTNAYFQLENIPKFPTEKKMPFMEWFKGWSGCEGSEVSFTADFYEIAMEEYCQYYYCLPKFVIRFLKRKHNGGFTPRKWDLIETADKGTCYKCTTYNSKEEAINAMNYEIAVENEMYDMVCGRYPQIVRHGKTAATIFSPMSKKQYCSYYQIVAKC